MINKECLKRNVYDYLKYCNENGSFKGVGIVSDKQMVFYIQLLGEEYATHDNIAVRMENEIHPESRRNGWNAIRENNIHIFSTGEELIIDLPNNGDFTRSQYLFLNEILNQVQKYNTEVEETKRVWVMIGCYDRNHFQDYDRYDLEGIKEELKYLVTRDITLEEECIIGTTLELSKQKENMKFQLNLENCQTINDFFQFLKKAKRYYEDDYYGELFDSLIPNFLDIWNYLPKISIEDGLKEFHSLTYQNLIEKLEEFTNKNTK